MRRLLVLLVITAFALAACDGWPVYTTPYNAPTLLPSRTPSILTPTPLVLTPTPSSTQSTETPSPTPATETPTEVDMTPSLTLTASLTAVPSLTLPPASLKADVLGCDTSIDITHGMGEVTDAYVTISNLTGTEVNDLCATLNGLDEGRPHPDKTKCMQSLLSGYQVTLKLTVDTTYKEQSPIQVDLTSSGNLLLRVGEPACTAIGLLRPDSEGLGIPVPIP